MAIYTGTSDANGDFNISFGGNSYSSAQKVTVTSAKDGGTKTIELFAPSDLTGGGVIRFSGTMLNFPTNVGDVEILDLSGTIGPYAFDGTNGGFARSATALTISGGDINVGNYSFSNWRNIQNFTVNAIVKKLGQWSFAYLEKVTSVNAFNTILSTITTGEVPISCFFGNKAVVGHLIIPNNITSIRTQAFTNWNAINKVTIGSSVTILETQCFSGLTVCSEIVCLPTTPPTYESGALINLNTSCVIKVPSASLAAYQTATNWSAHASKMVVV